MTLYIDCTQSCPCAQWSELMAMPMNLLIKKMMFTSWKREEILDSKPSSMVVDDPEVKPSEVDKEPAGKNS